MAVVVLLLWVGGFAARGQATVTTLGGGPTDANPSSFSGNADGTTLQQAQFRTPGGMALDVSGGVLFVADTGNNSVRRLDLGTARTTTLITGLAAPVDVYVDAETNLFVLTSGDGLIRQYDPFGNLTKVVNGVAVTGPTALIGDANKDFYVTEAGGAVKKVTGTTGLVTTVPVAAGTIGAAAGIAILENGRLAVSDGSKHVVWSVDPSGGAATLLAGVVGTAGGVDGSAGVGLLNSPRHLAQGGGDFLVLADYANHAVRLISTNGTISRLYGIPSSTWVSEYPGWEDGSATLAEARLPAGVAVDGNGVTYVSEQFYHLIRSASATGLSGPSGAGSNPPALSFTPSSGYFPLGQTITVRSSSTQVFYTTDGTQPTTNSVPVPMTDGVGTIRWKNSTNDLTGLRVAAFLSSGTNTLSTNATGVAVSTNSIGVPPGLNTNLVGGVGATVLAPVVVTQPPGRTMTRLSFRLEVSADGGAPIIGGTFGAVAVTTNDFIPVITGDGTSTGNPAFIATPYTSGSTRGLSINFVETNANLSLGQFGVVAMIAIPIPTGASVGDSYTIRVILPGGTDANGDDILLNEGPPRKLLVANVPYLVGDSSPAGWYNAGDFGNSPDGTGAGQLLLSDVNNAFNASVGIRPPYPFTDAFNAMDVFPEDTTGTVGGDGQIRFLDWQIILLRQQHLNTNPAFGISQTNWFRSWSATGVRVAGTTNLNTTRAVSSLPGQTEDGYPGRVWERQALMVSAGAENVPPGGFVSVPVHVRLAAGSRLKGLQFKAEIVPAAGSPALTSPVQFFSSRPGERQASATTSEIAVAWDVGQLDLAAGTSNHLGDVRFTVPGGAVAGDCYRVALTSADGSPDYSTQYEFETRAGCIWVGTPAPEPLSLVSDEWRRTFLGSATGVDGDDDDADDDGFANYLEYLAGTNPTNAQSLLRLDFSGGGTGPLELLSAPGKRYVLEARDGLADGNWQPVSTNWGTGRAIQFLPNDGGGTRFYRLRVDP